MRQAALFVLSPLLLAGAFVMSACESDSSPRPQLAAWHPTVPLTGSARSSLPAHAGSVVPIAATPSVVNASDANLDAELASAPRGGAAIINFTARWCGPCQAMTPTIDALAAEHAGRIKIIRVDFDDSPAAVRRFQISALPALIVIRNDTVVKRVVGYQSRENLSNALAVVAN